MNTKLKNRSTLLASYTIGPSLGRYVSIANFKEESMMIKTIPHSKTKELDIRMAHLRTIPDLVNRNNEASYSPFWSCTSAIADIFSDSFSTVLLAVSEPISDSDVSSYSLSTYSGSSASEESLSNPSIRIAWRRLMSIQLPMNIKLIR